MAISALLVDNLGELVEQMIFVPAFAKLVLGLPLAGIEAQKQETDRSERKCTVGLLAAKLLAHLPA